MMKWIIQCKNLLLPKLNVQLNTVFGYILTCKCKCHGEIHVHFSFSKESSPLNFLLKKLLHKLKLFVFFYVFLARGYTMQSLHTHFLHYNKLKKDQHSVLNRIFIEIQPQSSHSSLNVQRNYTFIILFLLFKPI